MKHVTSHTTKRLPRSALWKQTSLFQDVGDDPPQWMCQLECPDIRLQLNSSSRALLDPPYAISNSLERLPLGTKAISVLATHLDGTLQYNSHNVYGLAEVLATHDAVQNITGKRPFVLTRSSFTGVGAYAAHWTGDNAATWRDMARSLPGVLSYGLFGMPMGGADVCGFQGDTNEELCARWIALAAVGYPFARSHSDIHSSRQEPFLWDSVAETARTTLSMRYSLLPYWYTALQEAHATGAPVMRPMWLNYPQDEVTHRQDRQFMVGTALLVVPVLEPGATSVRGYFPGGTTWHSMFDDGQTIDAQSGAQWVEVPAPMTSIPLYVAGGSIIPMQQPGMTTAEVKNSPLRLLVALNEPVSSALTAPRSDVQRAAGVMYNDNGESLDTEASDANFVSFQAEVEFAAESNSYKGKLEVRPGRRGVPTCAVQLDGDLGYVWTKLGSVNILGWRHHVESVTVEVVSIGPDCREEVVHTMNLAAAQVRHKKLSSCAWSPWAKYT